VTVGACDSNLLTATHIPDVYAGALGLCIERSGCCVVLHAVRCVYKAQCGAGMQWLVVVMQWGSLGAGLHECSWQKSMAVAVRYLTCLGLKHQS
jgi:hypothetical protein